MELGCGVRVKPVKGRDYLYVWHYEPDGGRRRQVYEYVGPAADADARRRAVDVLEVHARRALEEARRRIAEGRAVAGGAAGGGGVRSPKGNAPPPPPRAPPHPPPRGSPLPSPGGARAGGGAAEAAAAGRG